MSHKLLYVLSMMLVLIISAPVLAQDTGGQQIFKLLRDSSVADRDLDLEEEEIQRWEPQIASGTIEVSLALGVLNLNKTLLFHEQMVYKFTDEATYWGDVELKGSSAFNPVLRLGYNITPWLGLESIGGLSFSEYKATITERKRRSNEPDAPVDIEEPSLTEFDAENRSLITIQSGLNAVFYPLAFRGSGEGRWHPYLTGGAGLMFYDVNSNFTGGAASSVDVNFGGGIRLLADENVSVRLEVVYRRNSLEFDPADSFLELDEGTTVVPLNEYPQNDDQSFSERPIKSFSSQSLGLMSFSLGVQGSF